MTLKVWAWVVLMAASALAQDVSSRWMDRVVQELAVERGPLERQTEVRLTGGVLAYYDDNIFLTEDDEESDTILVPFAQARVLYTEDNLELLGDLMGDYKAYMDEDDESGGEARFYGRARYVGSEADLGLVTMVRRESDPVNSVFFDRVERWVLDVHPRVGVDLTPVLTVEANLLWQMVRFDEDAIADVRDNNNWRAAGAVVYKTEGLFDWVVDAGALGIEYLNRAAPPDADGHFLRGGVRGKPATDLDVQVLVGYLHVEADDIDEDDDTLDAMIVVRWTPDERWSFTGTFTRTATFFGADEPWAIVNSLYLLGEYEIDEQWTVGGRIVYDVLAGALGTDRDYLSAGWDLTFRVAENVILEGGATYRSGGTDFAGGPTVDYSNVLLFIGVAASY